MKKQWFYVLTMIGVICLITGYLINPMGSLFGFALSAFGILIEGIALLILVFCSGKKQKIAWSVVLVSCVCILFGGKDIVVAGVDAVQGTTEIHLTDCSVLKSSSRRAFFYSYNLIGTDSQGERRTFTIDKDTYKEYAGGQSFSVQVIGWKYSEVIKEFK